MPIERNTVGGDSDYSVARKNKSGGGVSWFAIAIVLIIIAAAIASTGIR